MLNLYLSLLHLGPNLQKAKQALLLAQYTAFTLRRRKCQPISKGYWKKKMTQQSFHVQYAYVHIHISIHICNKQIIIN